MSIQQEQDLIKHRNASVSRAPLPALAEDHLRNVAARVSQAGPQDRTDSGDGFTALDIDEMEDEGLEPHTPRLVIRGAQSAPTPPPALPQRTKIDWLAFSTDETSDILKQFVQIFIPNASFFPSNKGWNGYRSSININLYGQPLGLIAYSAPNHDRNYLSLSGTGCREIEDWNLLTHYLKVMQQVKLSRVDIAADFYNGEITQELIRQANRDKKFKLPKSRHDPLFDPREPTGGDGLSPLGWTYYVGKRESGKYLRIYHKGAEQFGKLPILAQKQFSSNWGNIAVGEEYNAPDASKFQDWVRAEIEYTSKNRELSLEMINDRDNHFAGAYPYLNEILPMAEPKRPKTLPNTLQIDSEIMFQNIMQQYGSFLTTMLSIGMSTEEVLKKCISGKQSQRFIKAGGLNLIQPFDPRILEVKKAPQDE